METNNGLSSPKIALLIDFDNVILGIDEPGFDAELVVNALRERGQIVLGRCYGDWYRHNRHRRKLMEQGLELVETPAFGPVIKNSADIRIALDGFEIGMTQHHIDTFCIVSGDSDFLPLIKKLQYLGKKVLVICGNRFTSDMVRRNCNEFIAYENLLAASVGATEDATTLEGAFALLHRAMAALRERGSDIRTSTLKQMMLQLNPVFSERTLGCAQFRGFLDKAVSANIVKLGPRDKVSGELHVLLPEEDESNITERAEVKAREEGRTRDDSRPKEREKSSERTSERGSDRLPDRLARRAGRRAEAESVLASMAQESAALAEARIENPPATLEALTTTTEAAPTTEEAPTDYSEHVLSRNELMSRGLRRGRLKFSGKTGRTEAVQAAASEPETIQPEIVQAETPNSLFVEETFPADPASLSGDSPVEIQVKPEVIDVLDTEQVSTENSGLELVDELSPPADALPEGEATTPTPEEAAFQALEVSDPAPEAPTDDKPKRARSRRRKKSDDKGTEATVSALENSIAAVDVTEPLNAGSTPEAEPAATAEPVVEAVAPIEDFPETTGGDTATAEAATEAAAEPKKPTRRRRTPRKKAETSSDAVADNNFPTTESSAVVTPEPAT